MRWTIFRRSDNVEDRRGGRVFRARWPRREGGGLGIGTVMCLASSAGRWALIPCFDWRR